MDKNAKLIEIFENEQFKTAAENITSAEELQKLFAKYGLELTLDEVDSLCVQISSSLKAGELDETDLEPVVGGMFFLGAVVGAGALAIGAIAQYIARTRRTGR